MKQNFRIIFLAILISLNFACRKVSDGIAPSGLPETPTADSNITISNTSATGFTITWLPANDDVTPAAELQYKVVYSTSNNLTTVELAESNGVVAMDWTVNTLTTNLTGLQNSTMYYLAVLVRDVDFHKSFAGLNTATLCVGKRIFLATANNGNLGGKLGADSICNAQKPAGLGVVKAMLSDNTGLDSNGMPTNPDSRVACKGDCRSSTLYTWDWVLTAGQRYCTTDFTKKVGDAGGTYPVLYVTEPNVLSEIPVTLYSGFNILFANSDTNCSSWRSTSGSFVGGTTAGIFTNIVNQNSFITGAAGFPSCSSPASIICVEQ